MGLNVVLLQKGFADGDWDEHIGAAAKEGYVQDYLFVHVLWIVLYLRSRPQESFVLERFRLCSYYNLLLISYRFSCVIPSVLLS